MHHYVNAITNTKGDALIGYFVRCVNATTGLAATLYADASLTPILSVSGVADAAQVDSDGNVSFYITAGTYHLDIYATNSTSFVRRIQNLPMIEEVNSSPIITPQAYGAVADGVTDDSAAFVAAIAALKAQALNTGGAGFYKGSAKLFIPAGHYYLGTTALDVNHTLIIEGEGSGRFGPGAFGCTRLRWAAGTSGLRIQHPNTHGDTGTDVTAHDGAGGVVIRGLCLEGAYVATEGDYHGLVCRNIVTCEDLYIINWQGEGVKGLAGNQTGGGSLNGNFSVSYFANVRCEGNRIGWDIRGADANVVTIINCEGYQNRQIGFLDDNGSGPNHYIGCHTASNGVCGGPTPSQCTYSSKFYAVISGQETGASTNAPSGTTADNTWWYYVGAGSVDSTHPAWTSGLTWRLGGDFVTLNSAGVMIDNCYSEGNGFSQFNSKTLLVHPAMTAAQFRGGMRLVPQSDGLSFQQAGAAAFNMDTGGSSAIYSARDLLTGTYFGYVDFIKSTGTYYLAPSSAGHNFRVGTFGSYNTPLTVDNNGALVYYGALGYAPGAGLGDTVTQTTSRTTNAPTINKICGEVKLVSAAGSASWQTFTVPNSTVGANDEVKVWQKSGTDKYMIHVTKVTAGTSFDVTFATTGGTTTEQPVFGFSIKRAVIN